MQIHLIFLKIGHVDIDASTLAIVTTVLKTGRTFLPGDFADLLPRLIYLLWCVVFVMVGKWCPLNFLLTFGNRSKCGQYDRCENMKIYFLPRYNLSTKAVWAFAFSCWRMQLFRSPIVLCVIISTLRLYVTWNDTPWIFSVSPCRQLYLVCSMVLQTRSLNCWPWNDLEMPFSESF